MIKSLSGKTENINAALKSSDAEIRAKLKKIKEVEIELYDYVLNISETLEKLNPFILKKADELRNQNSGLREGFHSKGITSYDNVLKTVDDILDGTTSITDIDIGAITACLTQDNFKNEDGSTLCDAANMPEEGCAVDDSGMPSCDACVFGVTDYKGRDNCTSGTYSNCGGCYGGRNATTTDRCNSENSCLTVGSGSCTGYVYTAGDNTLTCSSGVSCSNQVTCVAGVLCSSGDSTETCESGYRCGSGDSCTSGDSGGACWFVSCNEDACVKVGIGCPSVSCTGRITDVEGTCEVVSGTSGTITCAHSNSGECRRGNTCENVSQVCTNCNVCEGCNNCNAGCNTCETCDGCNQCNTYAGTCGQGGAICSSGKGCQGNFGERCGSFFK